MTDIKKKQCRILFLLAGYRASGKTCALRAANMHENIMLFKPSAMAEFRRIRSLDGAPPENSGFYSLKTLEEQHLRKRELIGIHYDMLLPLQTAINEQFIQSYSKLNWRQRTPSLIGSLIRKNLESGFIYDCIHQQIKGIKELGENFDKLEISIIQSDWATNKSDWLGRINKKTGVTVEELQSQPKYSFNLAIFHTDPDLGQELYQFVHRTWYELMDEWGIEYMRVSRSGEYYDCQIS